MNDATTKLSGLGRLKARWRWVAGAAAALAAVWMGYTLSTYDVAATSPHAPVVERVLSSAMRRSVRHHAQEVVVPLGLDLTDPAVADRAIGHYSAACATCHGSPSAPRAPWMVMYPPPAPLTEASVVDSWSDEELFWIIKHGVKDTGMIALGPTHEDEDIWAVASFVRQLPSMSAARYEALEKAHHQARASRHSGHEH